MKLQAITLVVAFSAIFSSTSAEAGDFNFGEVVRKVQQFNRGNNGSNHNAGNPGFGIGNPGYGQPKFCPPPIHKPICKPRPPVGPPVCAEPPVQHCPPPVCAPPINRPPAKCFTMTLVNHSGTDVHFILDRSPEYTRMPVDDAQLITSHTPQPHWIQYHNGYEVVEFELNPSATYVFEWQGETLRLLEVQA